MKTLALIPLLLLSASVYATESDEWVKKIEPLQLKIGVICLSAKTTQCAWLIMKGNRQQ